MLEGAILGLIVGLIFYVVMFVWAMQRQPSFDGPTSRSGAFLVEMEPVAVIARMKETAPAMNLAVALEDEANYRLMLSEGMSLFSFGNYVPLDVTAEAGGSKVTVGLKPKVPQWGPAVTSRHRAVLNKIKSALGVAG